MKQTNTKSILIEVATRLFARNGYYGASIADIASATHINKSSLYHHFNSKEELGLRLVRDALTYCETEIFNQAKAIKHKNQINLEPFIMAVQHYFTNNTLAICMLSFNQVCNSVETPRLKQAVEDYFKRWLAMLTQVNHWGGLTDIEAREQAEVFLCHLHGSLMLSHDFSTGAIVEFDVQRVFMILKDLVQT